MKKAILLAIAIISLYNLHAQTKIGLKAGLSYNWGEGDIKSKFKPGIEGGFLATIPLTKVLFLQPELVYSYQRFRYDFEGWNFEGEVGENMHYLYLPVLLKYRFAKRILIEAGPQLGYLYMVESVHPLLGKRESTDYYQRVSFGASGGLGYQLNSMASVNARFYHGFTDAFSLKEVEYKRKMIQVGAALVF